MPVCGRCNLADSCKTNKKSPLWGFLFYDIIRTRKQGKTKKKMIKFRRNLERERERES